jgi:hypothetical protein
MLRKPAFAITAAMAVVLLVGIVLLGRQAESWAALGNDLSQFEAKSVSRVKILVWIRYRYVGDQGQDNICITANAVSSDGSQYGDTVYGIAPVHVGAGTASVAITKRHGKTPGVSEAVRVCLQKGSTGAPFYCETYPYHHSWSENLPGELPSRNEIGGFAIPIDADETVVRVDYAYTGDHGIDNVRMVAFAFQQNREQVPGTYPVPVKIKTGYGTAMLKIRRASGYPRASRDKLRVCMITPEGRAFTCDEFPKY